ncbi:MULTISPECIES: hypothetical protein [Lyngbya]|uniref:Uncharacterized protein n=1 Tax=Lyngbya aestuarii BL J TaxID=1348334 RepID=U7QM75_9CYAN|nr:MULTISPECIES: hypothetical protein [Lyngbya]EAW38546.1 hypothetical protein L8106_07084 [Lyngbya sp. PCC 8106]ERT07496.1 hypothetical protein M595_2547 [Lyngbya aestuarii BL J]
MTADQFQVLVDRRYARAGFVITQLIETEWRRVLRELDGLDVDGCEVARAAYLLGQFQMLDKLMAALSEGSLSSDYEIEAQWREKLVERVVEGFNLDFNTPQSSLRRYKSLAQQVAEVCGLEVVED